MGVAVVHQETYNQGAILARKMSVLFWGSVRNGNAFMVSPRLKSRPPKASSRLPAATLHGARSPEYAPRSVSPLHANGALAPTANGVAGR